MIRSRIAAGLVTLVAALSFVACGQRSEEPEAPSEPDSVETTEPPATEASIYEAALANATRSDADRERDAGRKPAEVLEFLGVQPGMTVLDLFTGEGYYAEIIAHVVGSEGKVIAQTNQAYMNFGSIGENFDKRFGDDRLPNVETLMAENNELDLDTDSIDTVMLVLSYHDLYLDEEDSGWPRFDIPGFLAELRDGLGPGGIVGIVDHYGATGMSAEESANSVHRIDPAVVVADMEAAGFVLKGETDILRNPDDDYAQNVFTEGIRGHTDRFVMAFESPD